MRANFLRCGFPVPAEIKPDDDIQLKIATAVTLVAAVVHLRKRQRIAY